MNRSALLAIGWLALALPGSAHAFDFARCGDQPLLWLRDMQTLFVSPRGFAPDTAAGQVFRSAVAKWNAIIGARFSFVVMEDVDGVQAFPNGANEVYFDAAIADPSVVSMSLVRSTCNPGVEVRLNEVDIAFNANVPWSTDRYDYGNPDGPPYSLEGAALHEVGHALGLIDENDTQATMNSVYPHGGPLGSAAQWNPLGDERQADRRLYPSVQMEIETDVSVSALKAAQDPGEVEPVLSPTLATRGTTVPLEYTVANLGSEPQTIEVEFYLSLDAELGVDDTFLGRRRVPADPGQTLTRRAMLRIPMSTPRGDYFLGFVVDGRALLVESDETNNAQALPDRIRIR